MEGDELGAKQVPASGEVGDGDVVPALGGNELVDTPIGGGASILPELDPDRPGGAVGRSNVDKDGTLMGLFFYSSVNASSRILGKTH